MDLWRIKTTSGGPTSISVDLSRPKEAAGSDENDLGGGACRVHGVRTLAPGTRYRTDVEEVFLLPIYILDVGGSKQCEVSSVVVSNVQKQHNIFSLQRQHLMEIYCDWPKLKDLWEQTSTRWML